MKTMKLWLDCDTGTDDAFAIIMAGHSPSIDLIGISTVFGNNTVHATTKNTLQILEAASLSHIKVYKGSEFPLMRKSKIENGKEIHGNNGLGIDVDFPEPKKTPEEGNAVLNMYLGLKNSGRKVTLCATGSLTNIALLFKTFPDVKDYVDKLIIMGGAVHKGNVNKHAEYNIFCDPEAAQIVFHLDTNIVLMPLELTHKVLCTSEVQSKIQQMNTSFSQNIYKIMMQFAEAYKKYDNMDHPPLHDPTTIAYALQPEIFKRDYWYIDVELFSQKCFGRIHLQKEKENQQRKVLVCSEIEVDKFWELMFTALFSANRASLTK